MDQKFSGFYKLYLIIFSAFLIIHKSIQQPAPSLPTSWTKSGSTPPKGYQCYALCLSKCVSEEGKKGSSQVSPLENCKQKCQSYEKNLLCDSSNTLCQSKCDRLLIDRHVETGSSGLTVPENVTVNYAVIPQPTPHEADLKWNDVPNAILYVVKYIDLTDETASGPTINVTTDNDFHFIKPTLCSTYAFAVASVSLASVSSFSGTVILDEPKPIVPNPSYTVISAARINEPFMVNLDDGLGHQYNSTVVVRIGFTPPPNWNLTSEITRIDANVLILNAGVPRLSFATEPRRVPGLAEFDVRLPGAIADTTAYCKFMFTVEKLFTKCDDQNAVVYPSAYNPKLDKITPGLTVQINCLEIKNSGCNYVAPALTPSCGNKDVTTAVSHKDGSETADVTVSFAPHHDPYAGHQILWYNVTFGEGKKATNTTESILYNLTKIISSMRLMNGTRNFTLTNVGVGKVYVVFICNVYDLQNQRILGDWNEIQRYSIDLTTFQRKSQAASNSDYHLLIMILAPIMAIILIVSTIGVFCMLKKRRNKANHVNQYGSTSDQDGRYVTMKKKYDHWEIPRRRLQIDETQKLGSGAFGAVYKGRITGTLIKQKESKSVLAEQWMQAEDCEVAVKMLPAYADDISKSEFQSEINLMKQLGYHERLVNMLACVTADDPLCLIVEYCADGDLLNHLRKRRKYMIELQEKGIDINNVADGDNVDFSMILCKKDLISFAWQICVGLEYLSERGFIHRDVAARNVLVASGKRAKIGDFGLCRYSCSDPVYLSKGGRLPIKWMAIEAIKSYEFTIKSDVWSYGVLLFEIVTLGGSPYPGVQPNEIEAFLGSGQRMEQPDDCPYELYEVMLDCWRAEPEKRPTFTNLREGMRLMLEHITEDYYYMGLSQSRDYYNHAYQQDEFADPGPSTHGPIDQSKSTDPDPANQSSPPSPTDTISFDDSGDNEADVFEAPQSLSPPERDNDKTNESQKDEAASSSIPDTTPKKAPAPPLPPRLRPRRLNSVGGESVSSLDENLCASPAFIARRHDSTSSDQALLSPALFGDKHGNFPKFFKFTPSTKLEPLPELPSVPVTAENYLGKPKGNTTN